MNLHILSMPFSETTTEWEHCAFTARTRVFATMMTRMGYKTYLYGGEVNAAEVSEHVPVITRSEQAECWPDYVPKRDVFNDFDPNSPGWRMYNARAAAAIFDRAEPGDILCLTMGMSHRPICAGFPKMFHVETGIGYSGIWAPYRVFESKAWRDYLTGKYEARDDVRFYDAVIPRSYEMEDFPAGTGDHGYLAFVGRLTARKGPQIAAEAAARAGVPLIVAGQGMHSTKPGEIVCTDGTRIVGDVFYAGVLDPQERAELMGGALACFTPTTYFEPFGGVSVECQLTGTPAIVSDWGGLPENVIEGKTGFACSTLAEFADAVSRAGELDRSFVRQHAIDTWSIEAVGRRFDAYFTKLQGLLGAGWYS